MLAILKTSADTWHVIEVPNNITLMTYAETIEEVLEQLEKREQLED